MARERSAWYSFVRWLVRSLFFGGVTGGLRVEGLANIPKEGSLIVAPNHVSHLDPPAVACAISRQLCFMAKEELFRGLFGKIIASLGAFPVRRGEGDTESIRRTIALLQEGRAVLVFPEGTRGDGVTMNPINRGAAMLAKRTSALVLPVGIAGTNVVLPRGQKKRRRHPITIAFGEPFRYADFGAQTEKDNREAFARELERRIAELCDQHGYPLKTATEIARPAQSSGPQRGAEVQSLQSGDTPGQS